MGITVLSVAKSYSNRGNHRHRPSTKKHWYLYFIDTEGKFKSKRINAIEAMIYKSQRRHRYKVVCEQCATALVFALKSRDFDELCCPVCSSNIVQSTSSED